MADRIPTPADREALVELMARTAWETWRISEVAEEVYRHVSWELLLTWGEAGNKAPQLLADAAREEMRAVLSTLDKAGVVYGPAEPTPKMLVSAGTVNNYADDTGTADADHIAWYRDVLAASPYAPTTPAEPAAAE